MGVFADFFFFLRVADLSSHFFLWLISPEAEFLKGKFVWVNWDVDELMARKEEIAGGDALTVGLLKWA